MRAPLPLRRPDPGKVGNYPTGSAGDGHDANRASIGFSNRSAGAKPSLAAMRLRLQQGRATRRSSASCIASCAGGNGKIMSDHGRFSKSGPIGRRSLLATLVPVVLAVWLMLTGCGLTHLGSTPPDDRVNLANHELVGAWIQHDGPGRLEFKSDGTFSGYALPPEMFEGYDGLNGVGSGGPVSMSGLWVLSAPLVDPSGPHNHVSLTLLIYQSVPTNIGFDFRVERRDSQTALVVYLIDPDVDDVVYFVRCGSCEISGWPSASARTGSS